ERAVVSALERRREDARATPGPTPGTWHIRRAVPPRTAVTAIIDVGGPVSGLAAHARALSSAADDGPLQVEVVLARGDTAEGELADAIADLEGHPKVRIVATDPPRPAEA